MAAGTPALLFRRWKRAAVDEKMGQAEKPTPFHGGNRARRLLIQALRLMSQTVAPANGRGADSARPYDR
jgi:hypothetical protein